LIDLALAAGFVLAGGQSLRMGRDKALTPLAGKPLIVHALDILRAAGLPASIAGARSPLTAYAPVVEDSGSGPLGGICAALESTSATHVVFLSIDMPFLPPQLLSFLIRHARITGAAVTLPSIAGFPQTFPVVLDRAIISSLSASIRQGRSGCFFAFQLAAESLQRPLSILPAELLAQSGQVADPKGLHVSFWFLNVNDPAAIARAETLLARVHRVS
jgi:molybdenum cofactor guanylyltransferase